MIKLKLTLSLPDIGADEPTYLVTADDVDSLLDIEIQPLDENRKRKVNPLL